MGQTPAIYLLRNGVPSLNQRASGPFVYRLGRLVFNQVRGVRLPYGLPLPILWLKIKSLRAFGGGHSDTDWRVGDAT